MKNLIRFSLFLVMIILVVYGYNKLLSNTYAYPLKINSHTTCPPQSTSINVWLEADNSPTNDARVFNIPFDTSTKTITVDGQSYTFDNYLRGVLAGEVGIAHYFDNEVLKSMAILARTKAYDLCGTWTNLPVGTHGIWGQGAQHYTATHIFNFDAAEQTRYQNAVDYGTNPYLTHNNDTFDVQYRDRGYLWTGAYDDIHQRIFDPPGAFYRDGTLDDLDLVRTGFMQYNGNMWAQGRMEDDTLLPPYDLRRLLGHYYTGIGFEGLPIDPLDEWRFNILKLGIWQNGVLRLLDNRLDNPLILNRGTAYAFGVLLQNTGSQTWDLNCNGNVLNVSYHLYDYPDNTYRGPQDDYFDHDSAPLCPTNFSSPNTAPTTLAPGEEFPSQENSHEVMYLGVTLDSSVDTGDYWMRFDMVRPNIAWLSGIHPQDNPDDPTWPTQDVHICIEQCDSPNPTPTPQPTATPPKQNKLPTIDRNKSTSEDGWRKESQLQLTWNTGYGIEDAPTLHYTYDGPGAILQPLNQKSLGWQTHQSGQVYVETLFLQNPQDGDHYFCLYYDDFENKICYHYHVDRTPPLLSFTAPARDLSFSPQIPLAWQASDNLTNPPQVTLYSSSDLNQLWTSPVTVDPSASQTLDLTPLATTELLTYYVGLKATDQAGNVSQVSRVLHLYTGPLMDVSNRALQGVVVINQHGQLQLGIDNLGGGTLNWEVAFPTNPDGPPVEEFIPGEAKLLNPVSGSTSAGQRSWVSLEAWANQLGEINLPSLMVYDTSGVNCPIEVRLGLHSVNELKLTYLPIILGGHPRLTVEGCLGDKFWPQASLITSRSATESGWYNTPLQVTFAVTDNLMGVKETRSREVPTTTWETETPLTMTTEGTHTLEYYSEDYGGNVEPVQTSTLPIDLTPPTVTVTLANPPHYTRCDTLPYTIGDNPAGLVTTALALDGQPVSEPLNLHLVRLGVHTLSLTATDAAEWQTSRNVTFTLTATPESLPCAIQALVPDSTLALGLTHSLTELNKLLDQIQTLTPQTLLSQTAQLLTEDIESVIAQQTTPCEGCNSQLTVRQSHTYFPIHPRYTLVGRQDFTLANDQARTFAALVAGEYTLTQDSTSFPGEYWALLSVICQDETKTPVPVTWSFQTFSAQVTIAANQHVTCTFLNEEANLSPERFSRFFNQIK